jgi:hypothetical protein
MDQKIYLYKCIDGVVRQRCRRHIETSGPRRPRGPRDLLKIFEIGSSATCVACQYEEWRGHIAPEEVGFFVS